MKSAGVIGKRIVKIHQKVVALGQNREPGNVVSAIELEDGTLLEPMTLEGDDDYGTDFRVQRPKKGSR